MSTTYLFMLCVLSSFSFINMSLVQFSDLQVFCRGLDRLLGVLFLLLPSLSMGWSLSFFIWIVYCECTARHQFL